jgi:phage terminase Nu1 subunit (DNA packaging protein)
MLSFRVLSNLLGIPESTLANWSNRGLLPQSDDALEIAKWIINYYKQKSETKTRNEGSDLTSAKTRLATVQADKIELDNQVRAGKLLEVEQVSKFWEKYVLACKKKLLAIPTKLAPEASHLSDPVELHDRLQELIYEALRELRSLNSENFEDPKTESDNQSED